MCDAADSLMGALASAKTSLSTARYVRGLLDRFHGDLRRAVTAYNAGPYAVEKYGGVPPYAETRAYVDNVIQSYRRYKKQR
jgi:soluble lytic murein transglycosylase-like protein